MSNRFSSCHYLITICIIWIICNTFVKLFLLSNTVQISMQRSTQKCLPKIQLSVIFCIKKYNRGDSFHIHHPDSFTIKKRFDEMKVIIWNVSFLPHILYPSSHSWLLTPISKLAAAVVVSIVIGTLDIKRVTEQPLYQL